MTISGVRWNSRWNLGEAGSLSLAAPPPGTIHSAPLLEPPRGMYTARLEVRWKPGSAS